MHPWIVLFPMLLTDPAAASSAATLPTVATTTVATDRFPQSWAGAWKGSCRYLRAGQPDDQFGMEVNIAPTADPRRFAWEIVYVIKDKRQVRDYELVVIDATAGRYLIDEKNSIKIDSYFLGDTLFSHFALDKATVTASYRVHGDQMSVELIVADAVKSSASGNEGGAPVVKSHEITGVQRATLVRAASQSK